MSTLDQEPMRKSQEAGGEGGGGGGGGGSATLPNQGVHVNGTNGANIRRYLVLLQDCLAIKFVSISHLQQKRLQQMQQQNLSKCNNHFPPCTSASVSGSCHPNCSCGDDAGTGGGHYEAAVAANNNACSCCRQGRKCEVKWKNHDNQHHHEKPASNEESNCREDHQQCQFYNRQQPNQMSYHSPAKSPQMNGEDHVNHQISSEIINKSHKSGPGSGSSSNNKGDYDVIGGSHYYSRCSSRNGDWESEQAKNKRDEHIYSARNNNICRAKSCPQDTTIATSSGSGGLSMMTKVDHSMQALFLYKEFREINLSCFWNSAVHEAFKHLEYKGSLLPSTIIVGSPIRKHLTILKTAWSRKMLRSPSGYLIDFLGEIEELIADPIARSHFVPLSDSLCWTIHELTSSGQEAFVDDIFLSLSSAFPGMALPIKELIYQTLEKLTRERKIYQTAQGYFVVTPDTHRYISSTEPMLMMQSGSQSQLNAAAAADFLRNNLLLQQSTQLPPNPVPQEEKEKLDHRTESPNAPSPDPDTYSLPYGTFRRYNSLRIKKSSGSGTSTGCLPRRTLSMRLPKSKKNGNKNKPVISVSGGGGSGSDQLTKSRADVTGSFQNLDATSQSPQPTVEEQLLSRRRKHKSFLSRLLSFRSVRKSGSRKEKGGKGSSCANKTQAITIARNDKSSKVVISHKDDEDDSYHRDGGKNDDGNDDKNAPVLNPPVGGSLMTTSTQTSFSIENLNQDLTLLSLATPPSKSSTLEREDCDSGRCTDSHSDADAEITAALNRGLTPTMPDHHHHHHHSHHRRHHLHQSDGRRTGDTNLYEKIESDLGLKVDIDECDGRSPRSPSSQMSISPSPSTFTTMSASCSRGPSANRHHNQNQNIYSRCHSSASSGYSYRDFYNLYRRRYPSYYHQQYTPTPTSMESTAELSEPLKLKPPQPLRYPPRLFERRHIFDEINRSSFREKKNRKTVSIGDPSGKLSRPGQQQQHQHQHDSAESIVTGTNSNSNSNMQTTINRSATPTSTTTILTQTMKNSTNLQLEFSLPLGNIISAAMGGGRGGASSTTPQNFTSTAKLNPASSSSSSSTPSSFATSPPNDKLSSGSGSEPVIPNEKINNNKPDIEEASDFSSLDATLSEVNTMVNDLFTIKSFVKSNPFHYRV